MVTDRHSLGLARVCRRGLTGDHRCINDISRVISVEYQVYADDLKPYVSVDRDSRRLSGAAAFCGRRIPIVLEQ